VVARVAPDADLYLASFESPADYRDAVAWLVAEDVDVVVAPVSFFGKPGDGSAPVARVATKAVRHGVVFVAPAGNLARGHWTGRYDRVENGTLQFGRGERNYLHGDGDQLSVWLSWDPANRGEDYEVRVYRADGGGPRLVARSRPYRGDDLPNERVAADVDPDGTYYVTVHGPPNATDARLRLESPTHDLQHRRAGGSVTAPATAPGVVSVGAYDLDGERVEPYSGRGPTRDGRLGVDLVAPDHPRVAGADEFTGSSAAAPYAAGVAALVLDADPGLSPREVEHRLERTAADAGSPGVDVAAGHGRVRPWHAARAASNVTQSGL
jgi:subtilisin family serine protease